MMLSLALLMASSMGSSFVPKMSGTGRRQPCPLNLSVLRGGSSSDAGSGTDSYSVPPLSSFSVSPPIPELPSEVPLLVETVGSGNLVSPTIPLPVAEDEPVIQQDASLGPNTSTPGFLRRKFPDFPWHLVPNWLTYFRCLVIPVFTSVFYRPESHIAASSLFAVASATDFLDGYLARKWDVTSAFGAFLDPVVRTKHPYVPLSYALHQRHCKNH